MKIQASGCSPPLKNIEELLTLKFNFLDAPPLLHNSYPHTPSTVAITVHRSVVIDL